MMQRWGGVATLDELGRFLCDGVATPGPKLRFIITFDDGYANVVHNAAPVLRKHHAKGTVFVNSGLDCRRSHAMVVSTEWLGFNKRGPERFSWKP